MIEPELPKIMDAFVDRMANDFIIGFLFVGVDLVRVKKHEGELARRHLFGKGRYQGRPLGPLHRGLRINRGQFRRRLAILRVVLKEHGVGEEQINAWIEHDQALEPVITDGTDCTHP